MEWRLEKKPHVIARWADCNGECERTRRRRAGGGGKVPVMIAVRLGCAALLTSAVAAGQIDPGFGVAVATPAYTTHGPTVGFDDADANVGTVTGSAKPFADLLGSDGYRVLAATTPFTARSLAAIDLLVIVKIDAGRSASAGSSPRALDDRECDQVRDWVRGGGSLLLAIDAPPSAAGTKLASRFGVSTGSGWVFDRVSGGGVTTDLDFSRENGLLGAHPILRGRGRAEQIARVRTFAAPSLAAPRAAALLLKLSETAREAATRDDLEAEEVAARQEVDIAGSYSTRVPGAAQALALTFGKGRVVVLGDADLLSARSVGAADGRVSSVGVNLPGVDNRQFALNVAHWLSRLMN
jgi:hypothetical protein